MSAETPSIRYVPGGPRVNRYHHDENTIVLDEALKDYPVAHDYIKAHEERHAELGPALIPTLKHELKTDWDRHCGLSDEARALRAYIHEESHDAKTLLRTEGVGFVRFAWSIPMGLLMPVQALRTRLFRGDDDA